MIQSSVKSIALVIEVLGIAAIVLGGVFATAKFFKNFQKNSEVAYPEYRKGLGRAILLGLEILVAADIIRTVALDPTYESLGVLALIVVIRTFLSFSLEVEISGQWPWQTKDTPEK